MELQPLLEQGCSEYELIQRLQTKPAPLFAADALREPLTMFRCHFMLFNGLYQLRDVWLQDNTGILNIHTTRIQLKSYTKSFNQVERPDPLRDYYLNWENFAGTGEGDVQALLDDFWRRMGGVAHGQQLDNLEINAACDVLGMERTDLSLALLKRQYRKLQHQYHPDKGGSEGKAKQILAAYQTLHHYLKQKLRMI